LRKSTRLLTESSRRRNTDVRRALLTPARRPLPGKELFHVCRKSIRFRVYVSVPEVYSRAAVPGGDRDSHPGTNIRARYFAETAGKECQRHRPPSSRTLLVEVDVDNPEGKTVAWRLYVGACETTGTDPFPSRSPANTLLFRAEGLRVGVVKNNRVALIPRQDRGATTGIRSRCCPASSRPTRLSSIHLIR